MLIVSANDAARALAIDLAGSEAAFATEMNAVAGELDLSATHAVNATGLDAPGQRSSAHDVVHLGAELMGNPEFRATVARTEARLHDQVFPATNDLLTRYDGADGIKTGHTTEAGWCLLGSATRDGRTMIVAVLGASSEQGRDNEREGSARLGVRPAAGAQLRRRPLAPRDSGPCPGLRCHSPMR